MRLPRCVSSFRFTSLLAASWRVVGATALVFGVLGTSGGAERPAERPNIVYILADDLGWTDLGCQGSDYYRTPHIDRLAREGVRLQRYYNSPNCAPTRAVLMTGLYAPRTGIYSVGSLARGQQEDRRMEVPENQTRLGLEHYLLPQALRDAGYRTGMFGKWHLGEAGEHHPSRRGFDEAITSMGRHFDFRTQPPTPSKEGEYLADFLTDRAVDFIRRHRAGPFFLYLPHFAVHTPWHAKPEDVARWRERPPGRRHWDPTYAAMIQSVDDSVGRLLAVLDELDLARDTLVIFSSDNGGLGGYDRTEPPSEKRGITTNAPLRGGKGTLYEGGIRVPFLARWPGRLPAGGVNETPVAHVDVYPTLLDLAGARPRAGVTLDGVSLRALLEDPRRSLPERSIYWHFPGYLESYVHPRGWRTGPMSALHAGDLKLLEFLETGATELYDVARDPGERHNLADERPAIAAELRQRLQAWRQAVNAAMPVPKPATEP